MIDFAEFFQAKPELPEWFKNHGIFKEIKQTKKIFPSIGLSNFTITSKMNKNIHMKDMIKKVCDDIVVEIDNVQIYARNPVNYGLVPLTGQDERDTFINICKQFQDILLKPASIVNLFIKNSGLYLTKDILGKDNVVFAKQNESIFKVYSKLTNAVSKLFNYKLNNIDQLASVKDYNSSNINGEMQIVFASDGVEGAWDIATISQRGISSCQSWTGGYPKCTIGSVIDPFTAVMYLTSGSNTQYGTKMIRRCIVRFVVDGKNNQPCLFIEHMYPAHHQPTMTAFIQALKDKTNDKFPIVSSRTNTQKYYIPYRATTKLLAKYSDPRYINMKGYHNQYGILPYRDCFMHYKLKEEKTSINQNDALLIRDNLLQNITQTLQEDTASNKILSNGGLYDIRLYVSDILTEIDISKYSDPTQYKRALCSHFLISKSRLQAKITKRLNKIKKDVFQIASKSKKKVLAKPGTKQNIKVISSKQDVANVLLPKLSSAFKDFWKGTLTSGKSQKKPSKLNIKLI